MNPFNSPILYTLSCSDRVQLTAMALQWQGLGTGQGLTMGGKEVREKSKAEEGSFGGETRVGVTSGKDDERGIAAAAATNQLSSSSSLSLSSSDMLRSAPIHTDHTTTTTTTNNNNNNNNTHESTYCTCTSLINFWRSPIPTGQPMCYYFSSGESIPD